MSRTHLAVVLAAAAGVAALGPVERPVAAGQKKAAPAQPAKDPPATDPATMKVAKGFKVELLYSVPAAAQGSWVCMTTDPKGRLIVSDQYGSLYRVTPPPLGGNPAQTKVEQLPAIGMAQGLVWAFDALYVVVNAAGKSGLYRVTDTNNDDVLDKVELLRAFEGGGGEHGPHAVMVHPDGKRLTVVCGNQTKLTPFDDTRVPPVWGEDHLLPRVPDGNGFMKGVLGPGGAIYNVTPDGKTWELFGVGFRNQYDAAYNKAGDLFTYDADMEWDFNTPWYRPTRVCLVTSGSEFGWRNGAGKYPAYYPDNLPPVVNIGPGSPTGVCFGYGAKFPQKYQDAFFICDWSYGKLYAVHLTPGGSAYTAAVEEFITGTPLPLTDLVINPTDGAMYFTIGGRRTKSGLYRVTFAGDEKPLPVPNTGAGPAEEARALRLEVEKFHRPAGQAGVDAAWKELNNADRFTRYAAFVALEHQDPKLWAARALAEPDPVRATQALLALCRVSARCPEHTPNKQVTGDPALRAQILTALNRVDFAKLTDDQKLDLIRVYHVLFNRFGKPTAAEAQATVAKFDPLFPDPNRYVNGELCQVLIYLEAPTAAAKTMKLLADAPTQEEQLEYARALRVLRTGWTPEQRQAYFTWFLKAANYRGGNSFRGFLRLIRDDAKATLNPQEYAALKPVVDADLATAKAPDEAPRPFVKAWTMADLEPKLADGLKGGRDYDKGRRAFAAAKCFSCHRYDNEGGSYGPDLTGVAGRFSPRDLLESIVDPNKEISDQYAATEIRTLDGRIVVGRIVNLNNNNVSVNTNMLDPSSTVNVDRNNIESMKPSKLSMMPSSSRS
ncbi:MAG: c-type cytochrome [Gemmataceae bacterium]|nr:c-type cytochrome [Gemmataceae bacterium]